MQTVEVRFLAPEGEELDETRLETLGDLGIRENRVRSDDEGQVTVSLRFPRGAEESEIATEVEELAERISDATGDMDLIDWDFVDA